MEASSLGFGHVALEESEGRPLDAVDLQDEARIGILLEAAAVVSALTRARRTLPSATDAFSCGKRGLKLEVGRVAPDPEVPPQALLRRVLQALFRTDGEIVGKGRARRAGRRLLRRWTPVLVPFDPDRLVSDVFDEAPFLWNPSAASHRRALIARPDAGGFWCAGPRGVELRLRRRTASPEAAARLVAGSGGRDLWENIDVDQDDPDRLFERGEWARAARLYRRCAPGNLAVVRRRARCLYGLGRYSAAVRVLRGREDVESETIRIRCQIRQGLGSAARKTLGRLERLDDLAPALRLDRAEAAIRIFADQGRRDEVRDWVARILSETRGGARREAMLLAAGAAWDLRDVKALDRWLGDTRECRDDPELSWKWHRAAARLALAHKDGSGMVAHLTEVLRQRRRRLSRELAGRIWSELAVGRCLVDDLPGAERACRVGRRLLDGCEGTGLTQLIYPNLAEVRIRRGRVEGAESTILQALAHDRRTDNHRSLEGTYLTWARLELTRGRPLQALARLEEMRDELARAKKAPEDPLGRLLEARARGWLGSRERARELLDSVPEETLLELEPEERPALWVGAGARIHARSEASSTPWRSLWLAVLDEEGVPAARWREVDALEGFRRSRLVLDLEMASPGCVPPHRVRRAISRLRSSGAGPMADRLEGSRTAAWKALRRFLESEAPGREDIARLFADAGFPDARLELRTRRGLEVLLEGAGGASRWSVPHESGRVELSVDDAGEVGRALLEAVRAHGVFPNVADDSPTEVDSDEEAVGRHPAFLACLDRLGRLAGSEDLPILLLGESGTGKEVLAQRAHAKSPRRDGPFVAVNCASFTGSLLESALFGHVRGAFTGADRDRKGVFESGEGGTVFLDEIGDLPLEQQASLLRVLQEREIRRVGESFPRHVDVRIVSATHRDLSEMVAERAFRKDLFYRLDVARIELPPLRDRGEDVLLLAELFLREMGRREALAPAFVQRLLAHDWPGNVRELKNVISVASALSGGDPVTAEHLDLPQRATRRSLGGSEGGFKNRVAAYKRELILGALRESGGNQAEAARRLDITRSSLHHHIKELGIQKWEYKS